MQADGVRDLPDDLRFLMAQDRHAAFTRGFQFLDFGGKFLRELLVEALGQHEIFVRDPVGRQEEVVRHLADRERSEEHTSELQSLMRSSYAVFCLKKKKISQNKT